MVPPRTLITSSKQKVFQRDVLLKQIFIRTTEYGPATKYNQWNAMTTLAPIHTSSSAKCDRCILALQNVGTYTSHYKLSHYMNQINNIRRGNCELASSHGRKKSNAGKYKSRWKKKQRQAVMLDQRSRCGDRWYLSKRGKEIGYCKTLCNVFGSSRFCSSDIPMAVFCLMGLKCFALNILGYNQL